MLGLTHDLEISVRRVAVHRCLSRTGVATFVPNLDVLYSQVAAAIVILNNRKQKQGNEERGAGDRAAHLSLSGCEAPVGCHPTVTRS